MCDLQPNRSRPQVLRRTSALPSQDFIPIAMAVAKARAMLRGCCTHACSGE